MTQRRITSNQIAVTAFAAALALVPAVAFAQDAMAKGEVRKIDHTAGKITLRHGPIKTLDMTDESMTMVFHVTDPAMLKQVKVGDKVQFEADRTPAGITIMRMKRDGAAPK